MTFKLIGGDTNDMSQVVNQVNQNIAELKTQDVTNITKDDTGTRRVLLGKGKDGFYGLKVSQPGVDVYDGSDSEMAFNSDNNVFKIIQTGTASITPPTPWSPGDTRRVTIAHNLGYKPVHMVYVDNPAISGVGYYVPGLAALPSMVHLVSSYVAVMTSSASVDNNNLYIDLNWFNELGTNATGFNIYTWNYKYYILQETAN